MLLEMMSRLLQESEGHWGGFWLVEHEGLSENDLDDLRGSVRELYDRSFEVQSTFVKRSETSRDNQSLYWMLVSGEGISPDLVE